MGYFILRHTDLLAQQLQKSDLSAAEGQELTKMTILTLEAENNDNNFEAFYSDVIKKANR